MDVNEELKFWENSKKSWGGGGLGGSGWGGVRMDVYEELKFFVKIKKKKIFFFWGGGGRGGGFVFFFFFFFFFFFWGGGVRMDVNEELKFL